MDRVRFEELVREAIDDLPAQFAERLSNVAIVIEDEPAPELLRSLGLHPRRETLFGLYQGVPLDERGDNFAGALPDKISIYYRPLHRSFRTPRRIRREIRKTLIHEIAHHFGMYDDEIEDLGY
jgi:predicted Zn-dependent protease with MMP-like domain